MQYPGIWIEYVYINSSLKISSTQLKLYNFYNLFLFRFFTRVIDRSESSSNCHFLHGIRAIHDLSSHIRYLNSISTNYSFFFAKFLFLEFYFLLMATSNTSASAVPPSTVPSSVSHLPTLENPLLDPLFVPYNELSNVSLVLQRLVDETNCVIWRKCIKMHLGCKNKMQLNGPKIHRQKILQRINKWLRYNNFVFS